MESKASIGLVHRFFISQNKKPRTKPN